MKKFLFLFYLFFIINLHSNEIKLYPSKIIAESFLIEGKNIYGVEKLYDQNLKTSFAFGLIGKTNQEIIFYFDDNIELTSFEIANGFQEKDNFYELNSRVNILTLYAEDKNGNLNTFNLNVADSRKGQKFKIGLLKNEKINKITLYIDLINSFKGKKYEDMCITEIAFYGNNTNDLKVNNNPNKLKNYFNSIRYNINNDYTIFFNKSINYEFNRGGIVNLNNNELTFKYLQPIFIPESNNGIKGKVQLKNNELIFTPTDILISKGTGEDYTINWQPILRKNTMVFLLEQENCFIKLIPKKKYDALIPMLNYVEDWKKNYNNAPKGNYIPIVIQ